MGIQGFQSSVADEPEIDSPMRKKKKGLSALKLDAKVTETENKFEKLEAIFAQVQTKFTQKKDKFEQLKGLGKMALYDFHKDGELKSTPERWKKELEFNAPDVSEDELVEFNTLKKAELNEIAEFIHIL